MKRFLSLLLVTLLMVGIFSACGGPEKAGTSTDANADASEPSVDQVTLRFAWWGGDARHEATQKAMDAFMEKYPHIKVEPEFGAWDKWDTNIATQISAKTAPDVMQINWNWISGLSPDNSAFLDLNTVSDIIDLSQFPESELQKCTQDGNLQGIPIAVTGRIFYWDKTTFDEAGIDTPKSYADLLAAGETFKTVLGDEYYPLVLGEYDRMLLMVSYLESVYGKDWVVDGKVNYTVEEVKTGMEFIKQLEDAHVTPTIQTILGDGADSLDKNQKWIDGRYAGIYEWDTSARKFIDSAYGREVIVGDYFTDFGDHKGGFKKVSMAFAIASNSKHPKEAAQLINFLLNEEEGIKEMGSERGIPLSKIGLETCVANDLLDPTIVEASGKVAEWNDFNLDPVFEDAALRNNPEGVYYVVFGNFSYGNLDAAQAAEQLVTSVQSVLDNN